MSKNILLTTIIAAIAVAGAGVMLSQRVIAAAPGSASDASTAAANGITAYEKLDQAGGCGAPEKNVLDNDEVRVDLVSFPTGFNRCGQLKRRYNQLLVYIDEGDYTITQSGGSGKEIPPDQQKHSHLAPGTVVYHAKDSVVSNTHIDKAYRILFVQIKK